ncbi:MAG: hypothetical protein Q8N09_08110 [Thermodesulfovibrionia bacterium]|nr:hypothetical protein [Thermodesulfovibrionia bacterium]
MNQRLLVTLVDQILAAKQRHTPLSPLDRVEIITKKQAHYPTGRGQEIAIVKGKRVKYL